MQADELRSVIDFARGLYPMSKDVQFAAFAAHVKGHEMRVVWDALVDSHKQVSGPAFAPWDAIYAAINSRRAAQSPPRPASIRLRMIDVIRADATCYPPTRPDAECIVHYYGLALDALRRNPALTQFQIACGRKSIFLSCHAALLDCRIERAEADAMAKHAVGLEPEQSLPDPWSVRNAEVPHA
jgi:hypothetical protein